MMLGALLVIAGGCLLLYVAMLVYQIFNAPENVPIVKFILEKVNAGDLAFSGSITNSQDATKNAQFEVHWSESVRLVAFLFIGAVAAGILARILGVLVSCGSGLLKLATSGSSGVKQAGGDSQNY